MYSLFWILQNYDQEKFKFKNILGVFLKHLKNFF